MYIGICQFTIRIPENQNLKGKRRIVNSLRDRLQSEFKIAIAEVNHQDLWQLATLGLACVSNDSKTVQELLSKIINYIEVNVGEFELTDIQQEIISAF